MIQNKKGFIAVVPLVIFLIAAAVTAGVAIQNPQMFTGQAVGSCSGTIFPGQWASTSEIPNLFYYYNNGDVLLTFNPIGNPPADGWKFSQDQSNNVNCDNYDPLMMTRVDFGIFNALNNYGWPMIVPMYNTITQECVEFQIDSWTGFGAPLSFSCPVPEPTGECIFKWTGNPSMPPVSDYCNYECTGGFGMDLGFASGTYDASTGKCVCSDNNQPSCDAFCDNLKMGRPTPPYITECQFAGTSEPSAECGNQICEAGETYQTCPADCPAPSQICGNGIKEGTEQCDNGAANGLSPKCCSTMCMLNPGLPLTRSCPDPNTCVPPITQQYCDANGKDTTCPPIPVAETDCIDDKDNNCNGLIDCDDVNFCASNPECQTPGGECSWIINAGQ